MVFCLLCCFILVDCTISGLNVFRVLKVQDVCPCYHRWLSTRKTIPIEHLEDKCSWSLLLPACSVVQNGELDTIVMLNIIIMSSVNLVIHQFT